MGFPDNVLCVHAVDCKCDDAQVEPKWQLFFFLSSICSAQRTSPRSRECHPGPHTFVQMHWRPPALHLVPETLNIMENMSKGKMGRPQNSQCRHHTRPVCTALRAKRVQQHFWTPCWNFNWQLSSKPRHLLSWSTWIGSRIHQEKLLRKRKNRERRWTKFATGCGRDAKRRVQCMLLDDL